MADEFLGQASVPLKEFDIYERPKSRWYELDGRSHKSSKKYRGEIEVRISFIVKNISNEKLKKRANSLVYQSLLDIRATLKSEPKVDKHNISGRKFSVADSFTKVPKKASRSISFKLESLNTRRKSLVDKFLGHKRHDSTSHDMTSHDSDSQYKVEEESLESEEFSQPTNGVINEEMSQSQEEVRELGKNCKNKIVIEVKNEFNAETDNRVEEKVEIKTDNEVKDNKVVNGFQNNELQTIKAVEPKSSSWKPLKGSLKRAFSTSNLLFTNSSSSVSSKPVPNLNPELSSTIILTKTSSSAAQSSPKSLSQFYGSKNTPNNNKRYSAFINNEAIFRQTHNREKLLSALKKST